jgi:uridylate kinase
VINLEGALKYRRILLKLSGGSLQGDKPFGIDSNVLVDIAQQIKCVTRMGTEVAVVVGGGNFWRGAQAQARGMERATADYAGMLATIMNALALQNALEQEGLTARTQSAIMVQAVAEPYIRRRAIRHLEKGRVVIFAGGTGNPYMTTDTAAALRAIEIGADVLLMAKNGIDGVYDSNPLTNKEAKKFDRMSFLDALNRRLGVMDSTAISFCMENKLPIIVFNSRAPHSIIQVISGKAIGTLLSDSGVERFF